MSKNQDAPKVTPREAFGIFIFFFIVFTCIGYIRGVNITKDDEYVSMLIGSKLTVERDNLGIFLSYHCTNFPITYYIDPDTIRNANFNSQSENNYQLINHIPPLFKDERVVDAVLGGASAWTVKDIFEYVTSSGSRYESESKAARVALAFLAAFSGYNVGYYIAIHQQPACDSPEVKKGLEDHAVWSKWERIKWSEDFAPAHGIMNRLFTCILIDRYTPGFDKSPRYIATKATQERLYRIENRIAMAGAGYDFKTQDLMS